MAPPDTAPPTASVPDIPYFTPRHTLAPGTASNLNETTPTLFRPLKIRGCTLRNRIVVAPMCQYSTASAGSNIGELTPWHIATLGHYALKGSGLVFIEATGVTPNGRISPHCPGLWADHQIPSVRAVVDFVQSQGGLAGLQLAHAGRKSSTAPPWVASEFGAKSMKADVDAGGWPDDVVGPSGGVGHAWNPKGYWPPRAMTSDEIRSTVNSFKTAAARAVQAGVDVLEIHAAHGYLLHQFLSPITNQRADEYGGSFENRIRFLIEVIKATREAMPADMPLFLRVSATEWMDQSEEGHRHGSWDVDSTLKLARLLPDLGVDLLDVSSGGNHEKQRIMPHSRYQVEIAGQIRKAMNEASRPLLLGAVGLITEADQARDIVEGADNGEKDAEVAKEMTDAQRGKEPMADLVLLARQFMREPETVLRFAGQLGVEVAWPSQFLRRIRFAQSRL